MISFLRAFIWLRWRILVNTLRGGKRRDLMEDVSRAVAVSLPIILALFFIAAAVTIAYLAFHGGRLLGSREVLPLAVLFPARIILLGVLLTTIVVTLLRSMQGSTLGVARFLLLPVPKRALHFVEVVAGLFDPWLMAVLPALLLLFPIGIASEGRLLVALIALAAGCAFLWLCASLGALLSFLGFWLLRERKRAEVATLTIMMLLMLAGLIPAFLDPDVMGPPRSADAPRHGSRSMAELDASLPVWTAAIPSELFARAVGAGFDGSPGRAGLLIGCLAAQALAIFGFSASIHAKLLGAADSGGFRRRSASHEVRDWKIPILTAGATAVAVAQVRASIRTLVGRMAILGTGLIVFVIGLLLGRVRDVTSAGAFAVPPGHLFAAAGILFGLLTLHPILMNQLASDRAGLTLQLIAPIADRDMVFGKAVGGFLLFGACTVPSIAAGLLLGPGNSILPWISILFGGVATYLWTAPVSALLSIIFPKASNLGTLGTAGKAHGASQFFGAIATLLAAAPPALALILPSRLTARPGLGLFMMLIWALLAAAATAPLLGAAARLLPARRENLAMIAQSR